MPNTKNKKKRKASEGAAATSDQGKTYAKRRKGQVDNNHAATPATASKTKSKKEFEPPKGTWENDVMMVETVEEQADPKTGQPTRYAFITWNAGNKSRHSLSVLNLKCPQKVSACRRQSLNQY